MASLTVPTQDGPQIKSTAFGGQQNIQTNVDQFGMGRSRTASNVADGLAKASDGLEAVYLDLKEKAETIELLEIEKSLDASDAELTNEIREAKLGGARNLTTNVMAKFDKNSKKLTDGFTERPNFSARVTKHLQARRKRLNGMAAGHEDTETNKYAITLYKSKIERAAEAAISGWDTNSKTGQPIHNQSMAELERTIRDLAVKNGFNPAEKKDKAVIDKSVRDAKSDVHTKIIKGMIDAGDGTSAKEYYQKNKSFIDADESSKYDAMTRKAGTNEAGEKLATKVYLKGSSIEKMFEQIDKSQGSIEEKDNAKARVKDKFTIEKISYDADTRRLVQKGSVAANKGEDPNTELVSRLSGANISALRSIAKQARIRIANGGVVPLVARKTWLKTNNDVDKAIENGELVKMSIEELQAKFEHKLENEDAWENLKSDWTRLRLNEGKEVNRKIIKKQKSLWALTTPTSKMRDFMKITMKLEATSKKREIFTQRVTAEFSERGGKEKLTPVEFDELLSSLYVEVNGTAWPDKKVYEAEIEGVPKERIDDYARTITAWNKNPANQKNPQHPMDINKKTIQNLHARFLARQVK